MISVIISSRTREWLEKISFNIQQTIGVPFEIIAIQNANARFGICKAYNDGARQAKYDIFCFMHEDILFETQNWGQKVIDHLHDKTVGLIGNAGGDPKCKVPVINDVNLYKGEAHVILHSNGENQSSELVLKTAFPEDTSLIKQVACIDGMWMCTRRDVFNRFTFDEKTYKGFHAYDIDFSLQVLSEFKVCVVFDILMHHYSSGNFDRSYIEHKIKLNRKWRKTLPVSVRNLSEKDFLRLHWMAMETFMNKLIELDYRIAYILKQYFVFSANRFFRIKPFVSLFKKILVKKSMRLPGARK